MVFGGVGGEAICRCMYMLHEYSYFALSISSSYPLALPNLFFFGRNSSELPIRTSRCACDAWERGAALDLSMILFQFLLR